MRLPGAGRSIIDPEKVHDYLMSLSHPVGRFKARFFFGLGYTQNDWQTLARDLRRLAEDGDATRGEATPYGQKFEGSW